MSASIAQGAVSYLEHQPTLRSFLAAEFFYFQATTPRTSWNIRIQEQTHLHYAVFISGRGKKLSFEMKAFWKHELNIEIYL